MEKIVVAGEMKMDVSSDQKHDVAGARLQYRSQFRFAMEKLRWKMSQSRHSTSDRQSNQQI